MYSKFVFSMMVIKIVEFIFKYFNQIGQVNHNRQTFIKHLDFIKMQNVVERITVELIENDN